MLQTKASHKYTGVLFVKNDKLKNILDWIVYTLIPHSLTIVLSTSVISLLGTEGYLSDILSCCHQRNYIYHKHYSSKTSSYFEIH